MSRQNEVGHLLPIVGRVAHILDERKVSYALIGGLGVAVRGEVRATLDVDLLVRIGQLELPGVFEALIADGFDLDLTKAFQAWNQDHLIDFKCDSIRIDWLKPVLPVFGRILDLGGKADPKTRQFEDLIGESYLVNP